MKSYRLILFDLDGTLTDPTSGLVSSFAYALDRMGVDYGTRASLSRFIGPPLKEEWIRTFGFTEEEGERTLALFREVFAESGWCDNRMFDGIPAMLDALRAAGKKIALATSKPEVFAEKILDFFGISDRFDFIGAATLDGSREKKEDVLAYAVAHFPDVSKDEMILVGDRRYDAEGAASVGIDSLGVRYGCGSREELAAAPFTAYADTVEEIARLLG